MADLFVSYAHADRQPVGIPEPEPEPDPVGITVGIRVRIRIRIRIRIIPPHRSLHIDPSH